MADAAETNADDYDLPDEHDWLLSQIVAWANLGIEIGITLNVRGQLVSGLLVSYKAYMHAIGDQFRQGTKGSVIGETFDELFTMITNELDDEPETDGEGETKPPPRFVHLRNAQFFVPGQPPAPSSGVWWRGKISEVDGFSLGYLSSP